MPQPRKSSGGSGSRSRSGGSGSRSASSRSSAKSSSAGRSSSSRSSSSSSRSAAAKKGGQKSGARRSAASARSKASTASSQTKAAAAADVNALEQGFVALRTLLTSQATISRDLVLLTRERMQEAFDEAVQRGHMTQKTANDMTADLVKRTRREAKDVLADLEQLLGRGRTGLETAGRRVRTSPPADRALREVDRARRVVGVGPSFPILGYDDLTAAQITGRLDDLSPAQLRKVRDYERRHGNRKSVLTAIERKLS